MDLFAIKRNGILFACMLAVLGLAGQQISAGTVGRRMKLDMQSYMFNGVKHRCSSKEQSAKTQMLILKTGEAI